MSSLGGNWKLRRSELQNVLIGQPLILGSWGGGAGTSLLLGGHVVGSFNTQNSVVKESAYGILSAFYGGDGLLASGYKVRVLWVQEQHPGSVAHRVFPTASIESSTVAFVPMGLTIAAAATQSTYIVSFARGASISVNFVFGGFIVSTP